MKPHGNSKLTTKGDHLPPEVAEMADNLAPARTVPTKRGGGGNRISVNAGCGGARSFRLSSAVRLLTLVLISAGKS